MFSQVVLGIKFDVNIIEQRLLKVIHEILTFPDEEWQFSRCGVKYGAILWLKSWRYETGLAFGAAVQIVPLQGNTAVLWKRIGVLVCQKIGKS